VRDIYCNVCEGLLTGDGVLCHGFHGIHLDCFTPYISTQIEYRKVPLCCPVTYCCKLLKDDTWRKHMDPTLLKRYEKEEKVAKGYVIQSCPDSCCEFDLFFCNSDEKVPEICECEICNKSWCTECSRNIEENNTYCYICSGDYKDLLSAIVEVTAELGGTKCPECGLRGQKNEYECTHILCPCQTRYCYCCGMNALEVDSTSDSCDPVDLLFGHNNSWEDCDDKRCPMYLYYLSDFYEDFPADDEGAQERFHQIKAANKLRELKKENEDKWEDALLLDPVLSSAVDFVLTVCAYRK